MTIDDLQIEHPFGLRPTPPEERSGSYPTGWLADNPWVSVDGTDAGFLPADSEFTILWQGSSGDRWDGIEAAVVRLADDRIVAWQTTYGPTGSGFEADAYGGEAQVYFGRDVSTVIKIALDDWAKRELKIPEELWS